MTKLNLTSVDGLFISYDLSTIKDIKHGKAKRFHNKVDCEDNGIKVTDSIMVIRFIDGHTTSYGDNWVATFK